MLRAFFTYRGAFFWKMQSGMGDIVFAPLYEVLAPPGSSIRVLPPAGERRRSIGTTSRTSKALEFDVQARTLSGAPYEPLIDVHGSAVLAEASRCGTSSSTRASFSGRAGTSRGSSIPARDDRRVLRVEQDFDLVVLGVGLGAVPHVCREIVERDPRWRSMVNHVKTVATQAFQLWLKADMRELGWEDQTDQRFGVRRALRHVGRHDAPGDRRELEGETARHRLFLQRPAGSRSDPGPRSDRLDRWSISERVRRNAIAFLNRDVAHLWPNARAGRTAASGGIFWLTRGRQTGAAAWSASSRFDTQFWIGSVNPSDRYTLSLPGSLDLSHFSARSHLRQSDDRGGLDRLRLQCRLRRGGRDVGYAGGARDFTSARTGRDHRLRPSLTRIEECLGAREATDAGPGGSRYGVGPRR